ncbi:hypothetical protein [Desmospora profundinema]|uniref:DUF975 family protein n=1 Tax=Desmospora profundinema TaxID=1571184 RepID=A0ABU1IQH8_9BACL|nr:hypothetical protein [Desmospora profundinema]MDR6227056.1 hypothetical protein [Desmospora profundinema]
MSRWLEPFKEAGLLYFQHPFKIMIIGMMFALPIQFFISLGSTMGTIFTPPSISNILDLFLIILGLSIAQVPYIYMVFKREQGEEPEYINVLRNLKENITPVYVMGLMVALAVSLGFVLILPGILCLIFFVLFPYAAVMEKEYYWNGIKKACQIAKSNFFTLMNVLLFFIMIDWWLLWGVFTVASNYETNFMIMTLVHSVIQILILPYFSFVLAGFYIRWAEIDSVHALDQIL